MTRLSDFLNFIWTYKVSFLPVAVTYLLFDSAALLRRFTQWAYVPIYFLVFPTGHSDRLYAQYFNEDFIYYEGAQMSAPEKEKLRDKIRRKAVLSMLAAAVFAPWFCGFAAAWYLEPHQFWEFFVFFMAIKLILLAISLMASRKQSFAVQSNLASVLAIYAAYLAAVSYGLIKSYHWTAANVRSDNLLNLLIGFAEYAYVDFFINVFVVALVTWLVVSRFTNPSNIPVAPQYDE
jgi:hypothetical protein